MPKPTKRSLLEALTVARLRQLCTESDLAVAARARKPDRIDALVRSRRLTTHDILQRSTRDELAALCRAHGLSTTARRKADLVLRLGGRTTAATTPKQRTATPPTSKADPPPRAPSPPAAARSRRPGRRTSFYDLEFSVMPGGARKDAHFIRSDLAQIKQDLDAELSEGINIYLLCWYGASLNLDVYQRGTLSKSFDLHQFLTIHADGYPPITFDKNGTVQGHQFQGEEDDDDSLTTRLFCDEIDFRVDVAWDRIKVPTLRGTIMDPEDVVSIDDEWSIAQDDPDMTRDELIDEGFLPYGLTDREI